MNVIESRRVRHLILRVDRGEEIPTALLRALDQAEARAGWIEGTGSLEAAEVALFDQPSRSYSRARRIDAPCDVVSLSGNIALLDGAGLLRLTATLSRETELGLEVFAGELVWARAYALELHVTAFDDVALVRSFDERTGLALLREGASDRGAGAGAADRAFGAGAADRAFGAGAADRAFGAGAADRAFGAGAADRAFSAGAADRSSERATAHSEPPRTPSEPARPYASASTAPVADAQASPALPARISKPREHVEYYPEVGDLVAHFHFGECSVLSSDGDRIRLRQERDGRVREVALTMLRIEPPTTDEAGRRHFRLTRKN
jgi:predicted DNA-binding protein with PD1-like motif